MEQDITQAFGELHSAPIPIPLKIFLYHWELQLNENMFIECRKVILDDNTIFMLGFKDDEMKTRLQ